MLALAAFAFQTVYAAPEPQGRSVSAAKQTTKARTTQKQVSKKVPKKTAKQLAVRKATSTSKAASRRPAADKTAIEARRAETQNRIEEVRSSISQKSSVKKKLEEEMKQSEVKIREVRQSLQKLRRERAKSERTLKSQEKTVLGLENELSHEQKILEEINRQRLELLTPGATASVGCVRSQSEGADPHDAVFAGEKVYGVYSSAGKESERTRVGRSSDRSVPVIRSKRLYRKSAANRLV